MHCSWSFLSLLSVERRGCGVGFDWGFPPRLGCFLSSGTPLIRGTVWGLVWGFDMEIWCGVLIGNMGIGIYGDLVWGGRYGL